MHAVVRRRRRRDQRTKARKTIFILAPVPPPAAPGTQKARPPDKVRRINPPFKNPARRGTIGSLRTATFRKRTTHVATRTRPEGGGGGGGWLCVIIHNAYVCVCAPVRRLCSPVSGYSCQRNLLLCVGPCALCFRAFRDRLTTAAWFCRRRQK